MLSNHSQNGYTQSASVRTEATFKKYGVQRLGNKIRKRCLRRRFIQMGTRRRLMGSAKCIRPLRIHRRQKNTSAHAYTHILKELAHYWEDSLIKRPNGTLVSPAGQSPEHGPHVQGNSYDIQLAYDLFTNYIQCAKDLNVDADYRKKVICNEINNLLKPKIGRWKQLQEWEEDRDSP